MKKSTIKFLSIFLAISVLICTFNVSVFASDDVEDSIEKVYCEATLEDDFTDNEILIVVTPENNFKEYTVNDFSAIGCIEIEDLTIEPKENELCRIFHLTLSGHSKQNVLDSIKVLEEREDIYSAEPNYLDAVERIPDDPAYNDGSQDALDTIELWRAWDIETGSDSIKVGIIDSGIDASHPDLINRINHTLSESFVNHYSSATSEIVSNHGTHVASIVGAQSDDIGMTGVCWDVDLVSLRVDLEPDEEGEVYFDTSAVIAAIEYATLHGIQILNYSGGGYNSSGMRVQIENYQGLFVCAAGNDGTNTDVHFHYPSSYRLDNLISVGASNVYDEIASFSNVGYLTVDIFAPGVVVYGADVGGGYVKMSGTSMASPIVAGVAALLLSSQPDLSPEEIKFIIMHSVDIIYDSDGESVFEFACVSGGRINAYNALTLTSIVHDFDYCYINSSSHQGQCTMCGYKKEESHVYIYTSINSREHNVKCKYQDCGAEYTESHVMNLLTGKCKICGYNSNGMGTLNRLLGLM